jgi:hypothetical protein
MHGVCVTDLSPPADMEALCSGVCFCRQAFGAADERAHARLEPSMGCVWGNAGMHRLLGSATDHVVMLHDCVCCCPVAFGCV